MIRFRRWTRRLGRRTALGFDLAPDLTHLTKGLLCDLGRFDGKTLTRTNSPYRVTAPFAADDAVNFIDPTLHIVEARYQYRTLRRADPIGRQLFGHSFHPADQAVYAIQDLLSAIGLGSPSPELLLAAMHGGQGRCRCDVVHTCTI